jgi:hypothetical protein
MMNCYICEKTKRGNGTRYAIAEAVGICHDCGIAVCLEHSHKAEEPGSPLRCLACNEKHDRSLNSRPEPALSRPKA